jgi:hypothetical protein
MLLAWRVCQSCSDEHYTARYIHQKLCYENFYYGYVKIQIIYKNNKIEHYCLFPEFTKAGSINHRKYITVFHLNFDSKNPEPVLNKIKTYTLFA